jgi:capsular exopolysaccharide synthesis family protein
MSETASNTEAHGTGPEQALVPATPRQPRPVPARGPAKHAAGDVDYRGLLRAFCRRWLVALSLGVVLGGAGFAAVYCFLPPQRATASSQLFFPQVTQRMAFDLGERTADLERAMQTQMTLAKSRRVLTEALADSEVAKLAILQEEDDPLEWLEQNVKVASVGSSEIMEISLASARHSEDLVPLVAKVTMVFCGLVDENLRKDRRYSRDQLKVIANSYEKTIRDTRRILREAQQQVGSTGDNKSLAQLQQLRQLECVEAQQELTHLRSQLRTLRLQIEAIVEAMKKGAAPEAVINAAQVEGQVEKDPLMLQYEMQKREIERAIEDILQRAVMGEKEPSLIRERNRLAQVREAARKRRKQLESLVTERLRDDGRRDAPYQLEACKQRLAYMTKLEALLVDEVKRLGDDSRSLVRNSQDLIEFQRIVDDKEEQLKSINKRIAALDVELESPRRVQPIQDAMLRVPRDKVRRLAFSGGTTLALLLLACAGVTLVEYRSRRLDSTAEVVDELGMTVIGTVPVYRPASPRSGESSAYWERRLVDSVDGARTMLLHIARREGLKVVMIASAQPAEGKTSLSGQLAASLARAGRRTLLIDADLRKPALHELFSVADAPGLSEVLRDTDPLTGVIQATPVPNLFLMAAGRSDESVLQILASEATAGILQALRQDYDFILVDSSPVLPVPDGLMIAQHVDGVLFSVMQRVSRLPSVKAACQRLAMVGARILGAVVSASRDDPAYGYRYHYPSTPSERRSS